MFFIQRHAKQKNTHTQVSRVVVWWSWPWSADHFLWKTLFPLDYHRRYGQVFYAFEQSGLDACACTCAWVHVYRKNLSQLFPLRFPNRVSDFKTVKPVFLRTYIWMTYARVCVCALPMYLRMFYPIKQLGSLVWVCVCFLDLLVERRLVKCVEWSALFSIEHAPIIFGLLLSLSPFLPTLHVLPSTLAHGRCVIHLYEGRGFKFDPNFLCVHNRLRCVLQEEKRQARLLYIVDGDCPLGRIDLLVKNQPFTLAERQRSWVSCCPSFDRLLRCRSVHSSVSFVASTSLEKPEPTRLPCCKKSTSHHLI